MNLTDTAWIDWSIIVAALLTAYATIWRRAIKPLVTIVRFVISLRADFDHLHDCIESVKATQTLLGEGQDRLEVALATHRVEIKAAENQTQLQTIEIAKAIEAPVVIDAQEN